MDSQTRRTLSTIVNAQAVPGRDDVQIHRNFSALGNILSRSKNTSQQEEVFEHVQFYVQQTLDRANRFLLSPKIRSNNIRDGLLAVRDQALALQEEYFSPKKAERVIVSKQARGISQELGAKPFKHIPYSTITIPLGHERELFSALSQHAKAHAEKQYHVSPRTGIQNNEWPLELIGAPRSWDHSTGDGVRVAVLDTGIDYQHSLIRDRFTPNKGYDFINDTNQPLDDNGHGTHVAGSIAAHQFGVAPHATLYALKFLDMNGWGGEVDLLRALEWCYDNNVDVVNGSFGSMYPSAAEQAACELLTNNNTLVIAAAGNGASSDYSYPASYENVISVAAVDKNKAHAWFSQTNDQVNISGPGVDVRSIYPGEQYKTLSGTSMATPHVAGAAALAFALNPDADYVRDLLQTTSENLGDRKKFGEGLVRCDYAVGVDSFRSRWSA